MPSLHCRSQLPCVCDLNFNYLARTPVFVASSLEKVAGKSQRTNEDRPQCRRSAQLDSGQANEVGRTDVDLQQPETSLERFRVPV